MSWRRGLYTALMYGLMPVFVLRLFWRSIKSPAYRERIAQRFGFTFFKFPKPVIWLHAVSVGETLAARPLVERLLRDYPDDRIFISSTTPTGSAQVKALWGNRVAHSYLPYDLPGSLSRFLLSVRPRMGIIMETEIWPNLYAACAQNGVPLVLVNARLSERSVRGYHRIAGLTQETVQRLCFVAARSQQDVEHFVALGAHQERVAAVGNIKFDLQIADDVSVAGQQWREQWGTTRPVLLAASTHAGEEALLLDVFAALKASCPSLLLVLVPRHPERFSEVADLCAATDFQVEQRSKTAVFSEVTDIIVGDSMGELLRWFAAADIAFIGKSMAGQSGGHNPLEAAAFAVPVISGGAVDNFHDVFPALVDNGGAVLVDDAQALQAQLDAWLADADARQQVGRQALQFFRQHSGVTERIMQRVRQCMEKA